MKFFKKKKSDKNLSTANQDQRSSTIFDSPMSSSIAKKPLPNDSALLQTSNSQTKLGDKRTSPVLVMPKPRRLLTPTRNILGRFDHDKTQVEDNQQDSYHQEISPILLPTPREDLTLMKTTSRVPQIPIVSSLSTILSDDSSSRVYMSACESVTNSADDNQSVNLPDMLLPQNQPKQNVTEIKRPIPIVSNTSSATVTPRLHHPKPTKQIIEQPPIVNPPEVQSHIQIEENPELHREKQKQTVDLSKPEPTAMRAQSNPIYPSAQNQVQFEEHLQRQRQERQHRLQKQPFEPPKPEPKKAPHPSELKSQSQFEEQLERQRQKQRQIEKEQLEKQRVHQEQEQILKELKDQIEFMEQQRIKDREEWNRKEQELLSHRHKMMETLMETKDQINTVLKNREENSKIAYDKQLRQQQLNQLHQKVSEMAIHAHQIVDHQQMEQEDVPEPYSQPQNGHYEHVYEEEFPPEDSPSRRRMNRSRSEEYLRYNTRSSSRSSHHYPEAPPYYNDEQYVRQSNSRNTSAEDSWKSSVSRKSSNASNKSRSAGIAAPPPPRYQRRPRARSIEETRWYQEQQWMEYMNDYQRSQSKPRRSRSVGRDSQRRYSGYMDDDDDVDYYEEDRPPRYNHYQQQPYVYGPPADYYYRRHPSMVPPQQPYMVYDQPTTRQRYSYN